MLGSYLRLLPLRACCVLVLRVLELAHCDAPVPERHHEYGVQTDAGLAGRPAERRVYRPPEVDGHALVYTTHTLADDMGLCTI